MPRFKVTLVSEEVAGDEKNPCDPIHVPTVGRITKSLVFPSVEAESREAIEEYFNDPKEEKPESIRGYRVHSIEKLP